MPKEKFTEDDFIDQIPQTFSEEDFADMQEQPKPTLMEQISAGFAQRPLQGAGLPYSVAESALPTAGAIVGGLATAPLSFLSAGTAPVAGAMAGAGAGRALQKDIVQGIGAFKPGYAPQETPGQVVGDVGLQAGIQGIIPGAIGAGKSIGSAIRPSAIKLGAQMLNVGPGIKETTGKAVLSDLGTLGRAPTIEEAGKAFDDFMKPIGDKISRTKEYFKTRFPNQEKILKFADETLDNIKEGRIKPDRIVTAREQLSKLVNSAKYGNPEIAQIKRELVEMIDEFDNELENWMPDYSKVRNMYREAKMAEEFSTVFPQNKNLSPNKLRSLTALGTAAAGAMHMNPLMMAAPLAVSPMAAGAAIRTVGALGSMAGKVPTSIPLTAGKAISSMTSDIMRRKYLKEPK